MIYAPRRLQSLSIRTQWAAVLALFAIAILTASGLVAYRIIYRSVERDTLASLQSAAAGRRELVTTILKHKQQRLQTAAEGVENSCDVGVISRSCAASYLRKFIADERGLGLRMWYGKGEQLTVGKFTAKQLPLDPGTAVFERDRNGHLTYSLREENREYGITLQEQFSPSELTTAADLQDRRTVDVFANTGAGRVALYGGAKASEVPERVAQCVPMEQPVPREGDGGALYVAWQKVPAVPGGCVVAARAASEVLAPLGRLKSRLLWLGALFSGIAIVLAWLLSALVTRPLLVLRRRLKKLEDGDFTAVPVIGSGEVREFSKAFAGMAESLRKSRAELERSEKRLGMAYRAARLWIWEHRLDTGVLTWRDAEQGARATTFRAFLRRVHPEDRAGVIRALRLAREGGAYAAEYRMARGHADYQWVYSWGQRTVEEDTKREMLLGVSADISVSKDAERLRAEKDRLMATAEMASVLAHEINNPLTSVAGAIYMARTRECSPAEFQKYLQIAEEQARRIGNIVRQLVAIYRPHSQSEVVDVGHVLDSVLTGMTAHLEHKSLAVKREIEPRLRVQGFTDELRHALNNLLTNAVESSAAGTTIRVRARLGRNWRRPGERGVRITVYDQGQGIGLDHVDRVFEPFVGTKAERGTGLGLWVTRSVVLKHGGQIRLRSVRAEHGGTCVVIYLPQRHKGAADSAKTA